MTQGTALLIAAALVGSLVEGRQDPSPTVVQVAASLHILVLLSDGSVVGLGENRSGQLARPPVIRRFLRAERVPLPTKAVQVAAGEDTSFALLDDGTVWAWGRGYQGELGVDLQGATERHTPAAVPGLRDVTAIAADAAMAMAVLADGTVRAWGALPRSSPAGARRTRACSGRCRLQDSSTSCTSPAADHSDSP